MAVEKDTKQIECLSFVPVCSAPDTSHGRHMRVVLVQQNFQPQPMMFCGGKQMIIYFEAWFFLRSTIRAAQVCKEINSSFRGGFQMRADFNNVLARNNCSDFAKRLN